MTHSEVVPARTRTTVPLHAYLPNEASVSTTVEAERPIFVERAVYFSGDQAGHASFGSNQMSTRWYFPANRTQYADEDFILILNRSSSYTTVIATYYFENQEPVQQQHTVGPTSRYTIPVHGYFPYQWLSVALESNVPIVAERAQYINSRQGGACSLGATTLSLESHFAEGITYYPYSASLELMNPGSAAATVSVEFLFEGSSPVSRQITVPARRRLRYDPIQSGAVPWNTPFSMHLISTQPIAAGRFVYRTYELADSIGSPSPAWHWYLVEGFNAFGYQAYICISNPQTTAANVTVSYLGQDSIVRQQTVQIGAKRRVTLNPSDVVPPMSFSTQVDSSLPIVIERRMTFGSYGIHCAMGFGQN